MLYGYCVCVQIFTAGFIEYWSCEDYKHPAAAVKFAMKMDTDLFALAKAKTAARSLEVRQMTCCCNTAAASEVTCNTAEVLGWLMNAYFT
jgi:hypothetical protein